MKYLFIIFLFISNITYAAYKVEFTETSTGGQYNFQENTENKAKKELKKILRKSKWMEANWTFTESPVSKVIVGADGIENTYYMHPTNFTYTITDISEELATKDAVKAIKAARKDAVKAIKDTGKKWKQLDDKQKDDLIDYLMDQLE